MSEANDKAEQIGIYFNGCDTGQDCECCGDRWYEPTESEKLEMYRQDVFAEPPPFAQWEEKGFNVVIHYKDGKVVWK